MPQNLNRIKFAKSRPVVTKCTKIGKRTQKKTESTGKGFIGVRDLKIITYEGKTKNDRPNPNLP
jgi:hypothetical protein